MASEVKLSAHWPKMGTERLPWKARTRASARADRLFRAYAAAVPPSIAELVPSFSARAVNLLAEASAAVAALDAEADRDVAPLWAQMLRAESAASSKIERIYTKQAELAAALAGARASKAARDVAAHVVAVEGLVRAASHGPIDLERILSAHRALLESDPAEAPSAGRLRDVQNWIGGSDETPRGADFVPPAPERVGLLMKDLVRFVARTDLPAVAQAAIAHAQFETIHPFTDGNGRIGRALVHAVMRRRTLTTRTMVPIAASLLADPDTYFDTLTAYRGGDVDRLVELFSTGATIAANESRVALRDLIALPERWRAEVRPRKASVADALLDVLVERPVLAVADVQAIGDTTARGAYDAIAKLEEHGVLRGITKRKRDRLWSAPDVFEVVDDLERRIGRRRRARG